MRLNLAQLRHRFNLLGEHSLRLATLHIDQVPRLVVIHDMHESEFRAAGVGQETGSPQGPMGSGGEIRHCQDSHSLTSRSDNVPPCAVSLPRFSMPSTVPIPSVRLKL